MKNNKNLWIIVSVVLVLILIAGTAVFVNGKKDTTTSPEGSVATSAVPRVLFNGEELKSGSVRPLVIYNSCIYYYTRSYENAEHLVGEYIGKTKQITEKDIFYDNYEGLAALDGTDLYKVNGYEDSVICEYDKKVDLVQFYEKTIDSENPTDYFGEDLFGENHLDLKNKYDRKGVIKWWYADEDNVDEDKIKKHTVKDVSNIDNIIDNLYTSPWVDLDDSEETIGEDSVLIELPMIDKTSVVIWVSKEGYIFWPCDILSPYLKIDKSVVDEIYKMCK